MINSEALAALVEAYKPSEQAHQVLEDTPTVLIVGVSGAGKGTIRDALVRTGNYYNIPTHVTRSPRYNNGKFEEEGVEHHFISAEQAEEMLKSKAFIEADFHFGHVYATSIQEFEKARDLHKVALTDIDINGVESFRRLSDSVMPVFLVPPSYDVWISRLKNRFTDGWYKHADDIRTRVQRAGYEIDRVLNNDFYHLVINDKLDDTIAAVEAIVSGYKQSPEEIDHARAIMESIKRESQTGTLDD